MNLQAELNTIFGIEKLELKTGNLDTVYSATPENIRYAVGLAEWLEKKDIEKLNDSMRDVADVKDWDFVGTFADMNLVIDITAIEDRKENFLCWYIYRHVVSNEIDLKIVPADFLNEEAAFISTEKSVCATKDNKDMEYIRYVLVDMTDRRGLVSSLEERLREIGESKFCAADFLLDINGNEVSMVKGIVPDGEEE